MPPSSYPKRYLIAVVGLTPQILTKTLWALTQRDDPFIPTEIHVITTSEGAHRLKLQQSDPLYTKLQSTFLLAKACDIKLNRAILKEVTMHRQSGRTGSRMAFTGFTGKLVYDGDLTPFMGILRLGEHLQVGGKTAFGFGAYRLEPHPSSAQEHQP